ncbi:MAG: hypothetical protein H0W86_02670 [Armatimonadetes bacterium]|nr:hypothetical protein [Armatimonadota bacterium]
MSVVAFVTFDGFYVAGLSRIEPVLAKAVAVVRARKVLDSSPGARKIGIHPGMAASEARYASQGSKMRFVDYRESDYAETSARWLDICCEYTAIIEPVEPHCAFLDLSTLAGARELALAMSADIYGAVRICPRIGIASSKLVARLTGQVIPEGGDAGFLAQLPIESLWMAKPEHLRRLSFLGYRTIGEVARLPLEVLQKQFGQAGLQISLWVRGMDRTPVRPLYPPEELSARFTFPQPVRLDQEVEAGLKALAEHFGSVLRTRDMQTKQIELEVVFEGNRVESAARCFVNPMQSPGALLTGLRLTLRLVALGSEIYSIRARFPKIEPSDRSQMTLDATVKDAEKANGAIKQLQETFGQGIIKRAGEVEAPRRQKFLKAFLGGDVLASRPQGNGSVKRRPAKDSWTS